MQIRQIGYIAAAIAGIILTISLLGRTDFDALDRNITFTCNPGNTYTLETCP